MLEAWSRTRDGTRKLSANFTVAEFACKDGSDPVFVDSSLAALLQKIRDHFGRPVVITSGYRTAAHNKSVGGAAYSQHLYGRAADIRVQGIPVEQLAAYAETCLPGTGGIGRYPPRAGRAVGWVHVDTRPAKSRWTDTKLEELTREVREHNNFARRVPILEEQMKVANHRIADLENHERMK